MVSRQAIQAYAEAIGREFRPEKVILFGSYASGRPTKDSDVDLLVVMPRRRWRRNKATEIRERLGYSGFPMDLLVWTPERLQRWAEEGDGFSRDILNQGVVLYEDGHAKLSAQSGVIHRVTRCALGLKH